MGGINRYIVENEKTARRFIKRILPGKKQSSLIIDVLDKYTPESEIKMLLEPVLEGEDIGLMSEAGLPAVADPGAALVKKAHQLKIIVMPLPGPSSIFLALMASGMNGQNFSFNWYLHIESMERRRAIKKYEKISRENNSTQIFIETPYRNGKLLEALLKTLHPLTRLCVAVDLSLPGQQIISTSVAEWKNISVDLHKRPAIFLLQVESR
jgi:16S rRNA (cytidine1402-2'-O)-methyltransferase